MAAQIVLILLHLPVNEIVHAIPSWTSDKKDKEYYKIYQCEFALRHHCIMDIKESNSH